MALNTGKVVAGGLAAGVVLNLIDYVIYTMVLADRVKAEADAFHPGMADSMMSGNAITVYIITDFIFGLLLVWTYAAIRPRFGPGPRTALLVAFLFWILLAFCNAAMMLMGMASANLWWTEMFVLFVNLAIASWVGAMIYKESGESAAV
jgi:hypothetical protein